MADSATARGAPERGKWTRPSRRWARKRARHVVTLIRLTPRSRATPPLVEPNQAAALLRQSGVVDDQDCIGTADQTIGIAEKHQLQRRLIPNPGCDEVGEPIIGDPIGPPPLAGRSCGRPGRSDRPRRARTSPGAPDAKAPPGTAAATDPARHATRQHLTS